jgi:hypothetical protein
VQRRYAVSDRGGVETALDVAHTRKIHSAILITKNKPPTNGASGRVAGPLRKPSPALAAYGRKLADVALHHATFTIGLRVAKRREVKTLPKLGTILSVYTAKSRIVKLRTAQVGAGAAVFKKCEGRWLAMKYPILECVFAFTPSHQENTREEFYKNMWHLAEQIAQQLGQKEIFVEMAGHTYRANAPKELGPEPYNKKGHRIR